MLRMCMSMMLENRRKFPGYKKDPVSEINAAVEDMTVVMPQARNQMRMF